MKKKNILNIIGMLPFVMLIGFMFGSAIINFDTMKEAAEETYDDSVEELEEDNEEAELSLADKFSTMATSIETAVDENIFEKEDMVNYNGLFQRVIAKRFIYDANETSHVYKMDNGQLTFVYDEFNTDKYEKKLIEFNEYCEEQGTNLIYVQAPFKINKYDNQLPYTKEDYVNENADEFLADVSAGGVNVLDLRDVIANADKDYSEYFFNGDHHWTNEGAFLGYTSIVERLYEDYGIQYDPQATDLSNFEMVTVENAFNGSQVRRTGSLYADAIDDYTYIYPSYDTDLIYQTANSQGEFNEDKTRTGQFLNTVFFENLVDVSDGPSMAIDSAYLNHNPKLDVITNNNISEGKILVIEDSYGRPVSSFMSLNYHEVHIVDLRYYKKSIKEYIEEQDFDAVVMIYNPGVYKYSTARKQLVFK